MLTKIKTILVAPDKFKGGLTAAQFCEIVERETAKIYPDMKVIKCPLADGGEGSLDCFVKNTNAEIISGVFTNANFEKVKASYALADKTAFIECSQTAGLVNTKYKNPAKTTTFGVGEQIADAINRGANKIYLALGGSATNDAGCGMAAALGFTFVDTNENSFIPTGDTLCKIAKIIPPEKKVSTEVVVLCDVDNVLFGKSGAAYVYAKQKGATNEQIKLLDQNLKYFNNITKADNFDFSKIKGSGAAGGLGAGAIYFLNAKLQSGIETFFEISNIYSKIPNADLIISGEGKIDKQSKHGKVVFELFKKCRNKKFVAFCGKNELKHAPFEIIAINNENESLEHSIMHTAQNFAEKFALFLKRIN